MNLTQLERILMVAQTGNITDVAQKLYISQPALSQTISIVEEEIGALIFDRRAQPMKLTPEGECFVRAAREILRTKQTMLQDIHNVKSGARGKITIGSSIPRCRSVWAKLLPTMTEEYPNVTLNFIDGKSSDFERMILQGNMDFALSNSPPNSSRVGSYLLNEERYYLVANRNSSFAQKLDKIRLEANDPALPFSLKLAKDERFILLNPRRNSRIAFNQMVREVGFVPCIAIETYNTGIALEFAKANLGIAIVPHVVQNQALFRYQTNSLSYFVLDSKYAVRDLYFFYDTECSFTYAKQYLIDLTLQNFAPALKKDGDQLGE